MKKIMLFNKPDKFLLMGLVGFLIGAAWLVAARYITYSEESVHYHANFALYVDGERDPFESFTFYEEVQSCDEDGVNNPKTRVHLHSSESNIIHVHDNAVTWGHLFANLGYGLGNSFIKTDEAIYKDGTEGARLRFILNGQEVEDIANRTIQDLDVLLIDYGDAGDTELDKRYESIPQDAAQHNQANDPAACSGNVNLTFGERLKKAIGL